jgi:hypothetical protein
MHACLFRSTLLQVAIFDMMDPAARTDCLKEVKLLQNLEHANIVRCHNSFLQVRFVLRTAGVRRSGVGCMPLLQQP